MNIQEFRKKHVLHILSWGEEYCSCGWSPSFNVDLNIQETFVDHILIELRVEGLMSWETDD